MSAGKHKGTQPINARENVLVLGNHQHVPFGMKWACSHSGNGVMPPSREDSRWRIVCWFVGLVLGESKKLHRINTETARQLTVTES